MSNLLTQVFKSSEAGKYGKTAARLAGTYAEPIAKTIEAYQNLQGLVKIGAVASRAANLLDKADQLIPSLQVVTDSACDKAALIAQFAMLGSAVGFGVHALQQYQGTQALKLIAARLQEIGETLEAQTVLMAQQLFPQYVYDMVQERLGATSSKREAHWFFVYHPDTDWYPGFTKLVGERRLGPRFCGWSNQLDSLFLFMLAVRKEMADRAANNEKGSRHHRPVKFHILIPAYQPVIVTDFLSCPEAVGDFVIEGKIHNSYPLVWLNLPAEQSYFLHDVGNWTPPSPGWVDWLLKSMALRNKPSEARRELGTIPMPAITEKSIDGEDAEKPVTIEDEVVEQAVIEEAVSRHNRRAKDKGLKVHRRRRDESMSMEKQLPLAESQGGGSLRQLLSRSDSSMSPDGLSRGRSRMRR